MHLYNSKASPSLATFNNQLWVALLGESTNNLYACSSSDGLNWSVTSVVGQSQSSPSICGFNGKLLMALRGNTTNDVLISSYDGKNWSTANPTGQTTQAAPALALFGGKLWVAFIANNNTSDILICSSSDGKTWSQNQAVPGQSSGLAPSLTAFGNKLWLAFTANNGSNDVLVMSSGDAKTWTAVNPNVKCSGSPYLNAMGNTLWLAFTGETTSDLRLCSLTGNQWSPDHAVPGQTSQAGPAIVAFNDKLELAFISADVSDRIFIISSTNGVNWSQAFQIGNYPTDVSESIGDTGFGSDVNNANFSASLTMKSDGTCTFSGTYNNTGNLPVFPAYAQNYSVACVVMLPNHAAAYTFQQQAQCPNGQGQSWNLTTKSAAIAANWPTIAGPGVTFKFNANNTAPPSGWLDAIGDALQSLLGDLESVAEYAEQVIEVIGPALAVAAAAA
jgi:hypothetical protein